MKYIVEFENEPCMYEDEVHFYKCIQAPWWGLSERVIKQLTPYQPDIAPGTNVGDTISRQAAIELAMKYCPDDDGAVQCDGDIRGLLDELENLPPAQPETATVTIGRTKWSVTMWYECDACGEPIDQKDCYCRNCERKLTLPESYRGGDE